MPINENAPQSVRKASGGYIQPGNALQRQIERVPAQGHGFWGKLLGRFFRNHRVRLVLDVQPAMIEEPAPIAPRPPARRQIVQSRLMTSARERFAMEDRQAAYERQYQQPRTVNSVPYESGEAAVREEQRRDRQVRQTVRNVPIVPKSPPGRRSERQGDFSRGDYPPAA